MDLKNEEPPTSLPPFVRVYMKRFDIWGRTDIAKHVQPGHAAVVFFASTGKRKRMIEPIEYLKVYEKLG